MPTARLNLTIAPDRIQVTIVSLEELEFLVADGTLTTSLGNKINRLSVSAPCSLPAGLLRAALLALPNLSHLVLTSPCSDPSAIFDDVRLGKLTSLRTRLPHSAITAFVARTRSIQELMLGCCGSEVARRELCTMGTLDLKALRHLAGPLECIEGMVPHDSIYLRNLAFQRCSSSLCTRPVPPFTLPRCTFLTSLTVHIALDDMGFMSAITRSAPFLVTLGLVEFDKPTRRISQSRRPWNNFALWASALCQLGLLKTLHVTTAANIVSRGGSLSQEKELVTRWLTGRRKGGQAHPSLRYIGVFYAKKDDRGLRGFVSEWERGTGGWTRTKHLGPVIPRGMNFQ